MPVCSPTLLCWVAPGVSGSGRSGGWLLGGGDGACGAPASHRSFSPPPLHIRTVAAATLATCRALWAVPARAPAAPPRSPPPRPLQPPLPRPWAVSLTPLSRPVRRHWLPGAQNWQDVLCSLGVSELWLLLLGLSLCGPRLTQASAFLSCRSYRPCSIPPPTLQAGNRGSVRAAVSPPAAGGQEPLPLLCGLSALMLCCSACLPGSETAHLVRCSPRSHCRSQHPSDPH